MLKCSVCGITATSEGNLQQHFRGRSHLKGLERQKTAEKSVFIRGLPSDVTKDALKCFLEKEVGCVSKIIFGSSVMYALVEFGTAADALKALQMPQLKFSGKKLVIKPRVIQPYKKPRPPPRSPDLSAVGKFDFNVEGLAAIPDINDQLVRCSGQNKMPVEQHLMVTFQLLQRVRHVFPSCLLIPFGSVISSTGTIHSDCDLCLIPYPPSSFTKFFSGKSYFSPDTLSIVERLERQYDVCVTPPSSPPAPCSADISISSEEQNISSSSSPSTTPLSRKVTPEYFELASLLRKMDMCEHVRCIPKARTPIIKFFHQPTGLNCDICVDKTLGPLNTRLMKAYCGFDPRVGALLPFVKLWARQLRGKCVLNSYTLSIMLIYSLQRTSPPVLPCLQNPGVWPRNMDWYKGKSFQFENEVPTELTAPWDIKFVPPQSLSPSTNTESPVSLLLHFFNFYANNFDYENDVVCVRCSRDEVLTKIEAAKELMEKQDNQRKNVLVLSLPLTVQDPFDLSHNLSKMNRTEFKILHNTFLSAYDTLQKEMSRKSNPSLLALFSEDEKTEVTFIPLIFSLQKIASLLSPVEHLEELDISSTAVRALLGQLVLRKVVDLLESRFDMNCVHLESSLEGVSMSEDSSEESPMEGVSQDSLLEDASLEGVSKYVMGLDPQLEAATCPPFSSKEDDAMKNGVVVKGNLSGAEKEVVEESRPFENRRKRLLENQEEVSPIVQIHNKRSKVQDSQPGVLDVLQTLLASKAHAKTYVCTALKNTWTHTRRARRKQEGQTPAASSDNSIASTSDPLIEPALPLQALAESLPEPSALLKFELTLLPPRRTRVEAAKVCTLSINFKKGRMEDFLNFYAVLKKLINSMCSEN